MCNHLVVFFFFFCRETLRKTLTQTAPLQQQFRQVSALRFHAKCSVFLSTQAHRHSRFSECWTVLTETIVYIASRTLLTTRPRVNPFVGSLRAVYHFILLNQVEVLINNQVKYYLQTSLIFDKCSILLQTQSQLNHISYRNFN